MRATLATMFARRKRFATVLRSSVIHATATHLLSVRGQSYHRHWDFTVLSLILADVTSAHVPF